MVGAGLEAGGTTGHTAVTDSRGPAVPGVTVPAEKEEGGAGGGDPQARGTTWAGGVEVLDRRGGTWGGWAA